MSLVNITPAQGGWVDDDIADSAGIDAEKLQHRQVIPIELFGPTTSVAAVTKWIFGLTQCDGVEIVGIEAAIAVQATGSDRTITVDLQKSTGAAAFATVLSSTVGFTNSTAVRTMIAGGVNDTTITTGDLLQLVVTVAGTADAQATGLTVFVTVDHKKPSS